MEMYALNTIFLLFGLMVWYTIFRVTYKAGARIVSLLRK